MINLESETVDNIILFGPIILFFCLLIASKIAGNFQHPKTAKVCKRTAMVVYFAYLGCAAFLFFVAFCLIFPYPLLILFLIIVALLYIVLLATVTVLSLLK